MAKIYAVTYDDVTTIRFTSSEATKADAEAYVKKHPPAAQKHMKVVVIDDEKVESYAANLVKKRR